jgi:hypothetical protein
MNNGFIKKIFLVFSVLCLLSCKEGEFNKNVKSADSLALIEMISDREHAMIQKDIDAAMSQFSEDVTWINSQGYYFKGKAEVLKFHNMLAGNDTLDYYYEAGKPRVRIIDNNNAIAYYSWKMFWYKKLTPTDTINKEIGLMTLTAKKFDNDWKWIAITNQHTPWFYDKVEPVFID